MAQHKALRFLFLLPAAVMIAFSLFFVNLSNAMDASLMNANFADKKLTVEMMAYQTDEFISQDKNFDTDHDYYRTCLIFNTELLNTAYKTYAEVFSQDLQPLSKNDNLFNPTIYPTFLLAVHNNDSGDLILSYKTDGAPAMDMHVYFRWIPTDKQYNNRFLVVVAISRDTVITQNEASYELWAGVLILMTTALNVAMIMLMLRQAKKNTKIT